MAVDAAEILTPIIINGRPPGWSWKRLDSVCEGVFDCPHSTPLLTQEGPFIVRSQDMRSGVFRTGEAGRVSEDTFRERIVRAEPKYGDLLYSREGTYFGIAAEVPRDIRVCLGQRMVLLRPNSNKINFRFLRYWLNAPVMTSYVHGFRDGTVAERLNLPTIRALPVLLPPLTEQHAIAHVLGTLDDKIELNRRMSETLEAIARAFFKSWFVDFDPVRVKAEGRDPCLPKHIADLFPDCFEGSELGDVPSGWRSQRLAQLFSLDKGLSYKGEFLSDTGVPMINLGCFLGQGKFNGDAIKRYKGEFHKRHTVRAGDLVIANTDITQKREVLGSPAILPPDQNEVLLFTHHVFAARFHRGKEHWRNFAYYSMLQDSFRERAAGFATGTTVLALPRDAVVDLLIPEVPEELISAFNGLIEPVIDRHWKNHAEARTLVALRDSLLPKLISGDLRVKDAERFIGKTL